MSSPQPLESLAILHRDPEQLADDDDGQRVGEVLDQIHGVGLRHAVEETIDDLLDVRPQQLHHARGERLADETAQPRVVRGIALQHRERARPAWCQPMPRRHHGGEWAP